MNKKVLIISYYWPPAGGPGVQRWLKFVTYLPEFGMEPIVYIPENPSYPIIDESLKREIPEDLTILKQPIKEPYKLAGFLSNKQVKIISKGVIPKQKKQSLIQKVLLYIRGNFFIPDARKAWVKPSVSFLSAYIKEHNIKTIITTGPPHSLHLIGLQLKKTNSLKWLADFRDPWTTIGYHKKLKLTKSSALKHKQLEQAVLNTADEIIVTSENTKQEFQILTRHPIHVITNGYDNDVNDIMSLDTQFTLSHIGSLLSERNPHNLWQVLRELISENAAFSKAFQLNLIGTVSLDVLETIENYNLKAFTNVLGYVSHEKAIAYQLKSQVLLLIEIDSEDTKSIIPGKLFEYMVSKRPIIALGPKGSDVVDILNDTETGAYFNYNDHDILKSTILEYFELYQAGRLKSNPRDIERYSRRELTRSLAQLI